MSAKLFRLVPNYQNVRVIQYLCDAATHQLRNVRDLALDVLLVRAE